jgi:ribosomal protein S18 acetylase RimI-like enzyme
MTREVAAAVHRVMQEAYGVEADLLGVADFVPLRRTQADIAAAPSTFLGAFLEGKLAAVAEVEGAPDGPVHVASLVVLPAYFRRGLATCLLRSVIASWGSGPLTVSTGERNAPALSLYAGFGFRESRRWRTADGISMVTLSRGSG